MNRCAKKWKKKNEVTTLGEQMKEWMCFVCCVFAQHNNNKLHIKKKHAV